jgi:3'(2'), 5'-bisphosphate nucleotidase
MNFDNPSTSVVSTLTSEHISKLYELAQKAGSAILAVYHDESLWNAIDKADNTPVTAADYQSSDILVSGLPTIVDCPVVSEEALPEYEERVKWPIYWLVDPMDGTREFLHKTGEFVINIALMQNHQPVFGLLYQPTTGKAWWGGQGFGAFFGTPKKPKPLDSGDMTQSLIALGSRRSKWQGAWRDRLLQNDFQFETESVGSALKFMRLAEGAADLYPRLGPTSEWDTAAPQAILDVTGGAVRQWNGKPLEYGKENVLNPHFIAVRDLSLLDVLISDS